MKGWHVRAAKLRKANDIGENHTGVGVNNWGSNRIWGLVCHLNADR